MNKKYRTWLVGLLVVAVGALGWWRMARTGEVMWNPMGETAIKKELPYAKYSFENLAIREGTPSKIEIVGKMFYYQSEGRRISGQINLPNLTGDARKVPVVVMARGYVEKEGYITGTGTRNAAAVYAQNGYMTLAPDFSGYGESDPEDPNALGARLVKPVEILDLLASLSSIPQADLSRVYLWGHSNGGQIMLSVAEIIGKRGPSLPAQVGLQGDSSQVRGVTLWAPVSKPFPYNILYYSDDASDSGKWLRSEIAKFENDYDVYDYSIDRYLDWITLPIQIHQGSADEAVPVKWSRDLHEKLSSLNKDIVYFEYAGADHNMRPSWDMVVRRDLEWFNSLAEVAP